MRGKKPTILRKEGWGELVKVRPNYKKINWNGWKWSWLRWGRIARKLKLWELEMTLDVEMGTNSIVYVHSWNIYVLTLIHECWGHRSQQDEVRLNMWCWEYTYILKYRIKAQTTEKTQRKMTHIWARKWEPK